jgi:chitin-binding protein
VLSAAPPPDGKIASANQATGKHLDEPGSHWQKHTVRSGEELEVKWGYSYKHRARRYNYFMTKEGWDPEKVLSRDQFESEPFYTVQLGLRPYWEHTDALMPPSPTTHGVLLPKREGYHCLLAIWEVADSGMGFYHLIDLDFEESDGGERPSTPTGLAASDVTAKQVVLTWNAAAGASPIASYRITRNGITNIDIDAPAPDLDR